MNDDRTLTTPPLEAEAWGTPQLVLTIVWHPDPGRVGQRALVPAGTGVELGRFAPAFSTPGEVGSAPLWHSCLSRDPTALQPTKDGGLRVVPSRGRMRVEIDGHPTDTEIILAPERLDAGVILLLGGRIALCAHRVDTLPDASADAFLVGSSSAMVRVRRAIAQVAPTTLTVLVLGESGTGKELVARAIHAHSPRSNKPLVAVNMSALSESLAQAELFGSSRGAYTGAHAARRGLWLEADGGTLFLDEIGDTPPTIQPMLLRVIETGAVRPLGSDRDQHTDVRLIAATDRDLSVGGFNHPLLRRLEAYVIRLPPLRRRREDLGLLVRHALQGSPAADDFFDALPTSMVRALCLHDWPGNVRQLSHAIRRLALERSGGSWPEVEELLGSTPTLREQTQTPAQTQTREPAPTQARVHVPVSPDDEKPRTLPVSGPGSEAASPLRQRYRRPDDVGVDELRRALQASDWCIRRAAQALGISRPSLYNLIARYPEAKQR